MLGCDFPAHEYPRGFIPCVQVACIRRLGFFATHSSARHDTFVLRRNGQSGKLWAKARMTTSDISKQVSHRSSTGLTATINDLIGNEPTVTGASG
jgi:hypothetical protein